MFWTLLPTIFSNEQTSSNQNIVINNIVKDKNESFLHDFNLNLLAGLASTALVGVIGYFVGRFAKKKKE